MRVGHRQSEQVLEQIHCCCCCCCRRRRRRCDCCSSRLTVDLCVCEYRSTPTVLSPSVSNRLLSSSQSLHLFFVFDVLVLIVALLLCVLGTINSIRDIEPQVM